MNDKFRYAPGKPGFGTKGSDGSIGLQGLSMYFTDYNCETESSNIITAIENNYVLWSISSSDPLPDNRIYVTGDLFVDSNGKIYEIDAESDTFTYKFASLNTAGYFLSAGVASNDDYNRYYNNNTGPKYLIDSVYADSAIAYYATPSNIYNIAPINFGHIDFSNIILNNYNPFTVFSSGETAGTDDAKSLAIVRDVNSNTFRIGNLDNAGNIRNVNLIFDVSSLKHTKQPLSYFNVDTPDGEILTNTEINANALFEGVFDTNPATFYSEFDQFDISIFWDLTDFTPDLNINADLYVFPDMPVSGTISFGDADDYRPLVYHDVSTTGSIHYGSLAEGVTYKYYMVFHKNGWERRSIINSVTTSLIPYIVVIPLTTLEASVGHYAQFCVSTNVLWRALELYDPQSMMYDVSGDYNRFGYDDSSLWIGLTQNTGLAQRPGYILVSSSTGGFSANTIIITQKGTRADVPVSLSTTTYEDKSKFMYHIWQTQAYNVSIDELPADTIIDVSIRYSMHVNNESLFESGAIVKSTNTVTMYANGKTASTVTWTNGGVPGEEDLIYPTSGTRVGTLSISGIAISDLTSDISILSEMKVWTSPTAVSPYFNIYDVSIKIVDIKIYGKSGTTINPIYGTTTATLYGEYDDTL
jgi:hypothetical protein